MEINLCINKHKNFIKKYFSCDEKYKYTITYPYIYKIKKDNFYNMFKFKLETPKLLHLHIYDNYNT